MRKAVFRIVIVVALSLLGYGSGIHGREYTPWSSATNLGPTVNSPFGEFFSCVSRDGLSLYFTSPRPGGYGGWDIWVSQRPSTEMSWGPPHNLGPGVNTPSNEGAPTLSADGHRMYFASSRPGGFGGNDIYVSRRHNKRDDLGWQPAENLGGAVNSDAHETGPAYFEDDVTGVIALYFESNRFGGPGPFDNDTAQNGNDIYTSELQVDETFGPAVLIGELSSTAQERQPVLSRDGLEIFFASDRPGTFGGLDLWVSTRASTLDPWTTPVSLGPMVNSVANDTGPALSRDGGTLYFQSVREGGAGAFDLYVTTRDKISGRSRSIASSPTASEDWKLPQRGR